jgi:hypothetical protein
MTCDETDCGVGLTSHGYHDASLRRRTYSWLSGAGARARRRYRHGRQPNHPNTEKRRATMKVDERVCNMGSVWLRCRESPRETPETLTIDRAVHTVEVTGSSPVPPTGKTGVFERPLSSTVQKCTALHGKPAVWGNLHFPWGPLLCAIRNRGSEPLTALGMSASTARRSSWGRTRKRRMRNSGRRCATARWSTTPPAIASSALEVREEAPSPFAPGSWGVLVYLAIDQSNVEARRVACAPCGKVDRREGQG